MFAAVAAVDIEIVVDVVADVDGVKIADFEFVAVE